MLSLTFMRCFGVIFHRSVCWTCHHMPLLRWNVASYIDCAIFAPFFRLSFRYEVLEKGFKICTEREKKKIISHSILFGVLFDILMKWKVVVGQQSEYISENRFNVFIHKHVDQINQSIYDLYDEQKKFRESNT